MSQNGMQRVLRKCEETGRGADKRGRVRSKKIIHSRQTVSESDDLEEEIRSNLDTGPERWIWTLS